jgi:hypothetical protein
MAKLNSTDTIEELVRACSLIETIALEIGTEERAANVLYSAIDHIVRAKAFFADSKAVAHG